MNEWLLIFLMAAVTYLPRYLPMALAGRTVGGPAKVAVLSSGLMGSLSGSAVANTATKSKTHPALRRP